MSDSRPSVPLRTTKQSFSEKLDAGHRQHRRGISTSLWPRPTAIRVLSYLPAQPAVSGPITDVASNQTTSKCSLGPTTHCDTHQRILVISPAQRCLWLLPMKRIRRTLYSTKPLQSQLSSHSQPFRTIDTSNKHSSQPGFLAAGHPTSSWHAMHAEYATQCHLTCPG